MSERSVKGTSLALTLDLLRARFGDDVVAQLRTHLPEAVRAALPEDLRPLPTATLPFETWAEVMLAVDELFGKPNSIVRELGRDSYVQLLKGPYRNWVRPGNAYESLRRIPMLWDQVTRQMGRLVVEVQGHRVVVRGYFDVPLRYRGLIAQRVAGTIDAMLEVSGAAGAVHIESHPEFVAYNIRVLQKSLPPAG